MVIYIKKLNGIVNKNILLFKQKLYYKKNYDNLYILNINLIIENINK